MNCNILTVQSLQNMLYLKLINLAVLLMTELSFTVAEVNIMSYWDRGPISSAVESHDTCVIDLGEVLCVFIPCWHGDTAACQFPGGSSLWLYCTCQIASSLVTVNAHKCIKLEGDWFIGNRSLADLERWVICFLYYCTAWVILYLDKVQHKNEYVYCTP